MLKITAAAEATVVNLTQGDRRLHISLGHGGCCGTYYQFTLAPRAPGQPKITLSPEAAHILNGATLDYGATLKPPRFRILRNPNTTQKCPCGRSFGAPYPGKATPQCQAYVPMDWSNT